MKLHMGRKRGKISYERSKNIAGIVFISPWILGFILLYAIPLIQSIRYTFNELHITVNAFQMTFIGLDNYRFLLFSDPDFLKTLVKSIGDLIYQVPITMVFSLIVAMILNQKFRGRTLVRAIFFLPVIIASGVVIDILNGDLMSQLIMTGEKTTRLFQVSAFQRMLFEMGFNRHLVSFIVSVSNDIFRISWQSGIQILLFIAGLQTIPKHLYDACSIDGATSWERFWKVTLPLLTPIIVLNLVYSITDNFTSYTNKTMVMILETGQDLQFALSATMAWIYFGVIAVILGIAYKLVDRKVVYL